MACDVAWQTWLKPSNSTAETAKISSHHPIPYTPQLYLTAATNFSTILYMVNDFHNKFLWKIVSVVVPVLKKPLSGGHIVFFCFPKLSPKLHVATCYSVWWQRYLSLLIDRYHDSYWYFAPGKFCVSISEWRLYQVRSALCQIMRCPHRGRIYLAV
mgnify:CR=1 FL=1